MTQAYAELTDLVSEMPYKAENKAQRALEKKHGTPADFALACLQAVPGDISCAEAHAAIHRYHKQWRAAK